MVSHADAASRSVPFSDSNLIRTGTGHETPNSDVTAGIPFRVRFRMRFRKGGIPVLKR